MCWWLSLAADEVRFANVEQKLHMICLVSMLKTAKSMHDYHFSHVAADIQQNFKTNKSLRRGYANLFGFVTDCLRVDTVPTEANALAAWENSGEWPPVTRNFLQRGGRVESVLRVVFSSTMSQDFKAGDGSILMTFEDEIMKLPKCRNDHEFGFVALACGIKELRSYYATRFEGQTNLMAMIRRRKIIQSLGASESEQAAGGCNPM